MTDYRLNVKEAMMNAIPPNTENRVFVGNGMYISCLCGVHKLDSTCEVYEKYKTSPFTIKPRID